MPSSETTMILLDRMNQTDLTNIVRTIKSDKALKTASGLFLSNAPSKLKGLYDRLPKLQSSIFSTKECNAEAAWNFS